MTPSIQTTFNIPDKQVIVKDIFDYSVSPYLDIAFGNVTAKRGSTIFHTNTNFDENADIVIGVNDEIAIDLPLDSTGKIIQGGYSFTYAVKVKEALIPISTEVISPGASPFSEIELVTPITGLPASVTAWLALYGTLTINFYDSDEVLITSSEVTGADATNMIQFDEVTNASFADIAFIQVTGFATWTKTFSYDFCDITPTGDLCVASNCYFSQLTATDNTVYPASMTVESRELIIQYPRLANGTAVMAAAETDQSTLTIGPNIYSGGYTVSQTTGLSWTQDDGLIVENTLEIFSNYNVSCDAGLCDLYACVKSLHAAYLNAVRIGSRQIVELREINFQVLLYINQYKIAVDCQDTDEATCILNSLKDYLGTTTAATGVSCGCGCNGTSGNGTDQGVPTEIFPLYTATTGGNFISVNFGSYSTKGTITGDDTFVINDSAASGLPKEVTWTTLSANILSTVSGSYQATSGKDATGGYVGLTLFKINFKNAANTFTSFLTNSNTAARTYNFPDKDMTVMGTNDIVDVLNSTATDKALSANMGKSLQDNKQATSAKDASGGYVGLTAFKINIKNSAGDQVSLIESACTAVRTYTLPDKNLTVIGTQDINDTLTSTSAVLALSANQGNNLSVRLLPTFSSFTGSFPEVLGTKYWDGSSASGAADFQLETSATAGKREIIVRKTNIAGSPFTITAGLGNTINGAPSITLTAQNETWLIVRDGADTDVRAYQLQ